jgi:hypothetical protein
MLTPRPTPLRNRIPRKKGIGTSHRVKRILGYTGTGTGGVGNLGLELQKAQQHSLVQSTMSVDQDFLRRR